jgi:ring-1,2-phenylacetyl-CoA epoxidase subunit PaaE
VLEAALAQDIDVPYACRAGVCSTCRCKVTDGEVEMDANHALEDYEVRAGYALSCQSRPVSARLAVDYDQ